MSFPRLPSAVLIGLAVAVMAACVWLVGQTQRDAAARSFRQTQQAQAMMTAMLDQETGLRGYLLNGRSEFLEPFVVGRTDFVRTVGEARSLGGGGEVARLLDSSEELAGRWRSAAEAAAQHGPGRTTLRDAEWRKGVMDRFRAVNAQLRRELDGRREAELSRASWLSAALIIGLSTLFALGGWLLIGRPVAAQRRREVHRHHLRERQAVFARAMQMSDTEEHVSSLVRRHLERSVEGAAVSVLRPGQAGREQAVSTPMLASGDVIGSVQVVRDAPLTAEEREIVADSVNQAAPVIANLRNLALAEAQAATDSLTGLPNRRALDETLARMLAQAVRTAGSLTAIVMDLDNFKQINDRHGHARGDDVLAATATALTSTLRVSDFVARAGGEEFVVLLPDTGLDGALVVAENLRAALQAMAVPGLGAPVTGSFGVAVHPEDARDGEELLRSADRALYLAKSNGRNRVEAAASAPV
ncbi:MAG TPA: diguanylate cyclase [Solirubrobacteraceae bacterium]|jgi:diguanylate cyclase (GGDEF)-like protein